MPFEYYAENYDWDLTLRTSWNLLMLGQEAMKNPEQQFSCYTGSMLLSFCAVESYMNSIAFAMSRDGKYKEFSYSEYNELIRFWERLEELCQKLEIAINKSSGTFQVIEQMRGWRNSLVHSTPYSIETTEIVETKESRKLHKKYEHRAYTKSVSLKNVKKFYQSALEVIETIKSASGIDPRAMCSYGQI